MGDRPYDPATNTFTSVADMLLDEPISHSYPCRAARSWPWVAMATSLYLNGAIQAISRGATRTQIFDPASNTWSWGPPCPAGSCGRGAMATTLSNGDIFVAGGSPDGGATLYQTSLIYNEASNTWQPEGDMTMAREGSWDYGAVQLNDGRVLFIQFSVADAFQPDYVAPVTNLTAWSPTYGSEFRNRDRHTDLHRSSRCGESGLDSVRLFRKPIQYGRRGHLECLCRAIFVTTVGYWTIYGWSQDVAGHSAVSAPLVLGPIDVTPPTTTITPGGSAGNAGWWKTSSITLGCTDNAGGSGCASTVYTVDGGGSTIYGGPFALGDGVHSIAAHSIDNVGNVENPGPTTTVNVDGTAPTTPAAPTVTNGGFRHRQHLLGGQYRCHVRHGHLSGPGV